MEKKLKVGEVVWAKIRGFPWWPGMVRNYLIVDRQNRRKQYTRPGNEIYDKFHR